MDIIDLRDIIENREDDSEAYEAWNKALMQDIGIELDTAAENDPIAIPDRDFVEYAQELADECGLLDTNPKWPLNHVDWESAAEEGPIPTLVSPAAK